MTEAEADPEYRRTLEYLLNGRDARRPVMKVGRRKKGASTKVGVKRFTARRLRVSLPEERD